MSRFRRIVASLLLAAGSYGAAVPDARGQIREPLPYPYPRFPWPPVVYDGLVDITAGGYHTCARRFGGNVYCWGRNDSGQVGVSGTRTCSGVPCVDKPQFVTRAMQVDAGFDHTCSVASGGVASCWGNNGYGQLGVGGGPWGGYGSLPQPAAVTGGLTFTSISAGTYSTCGTTPGGMFCWGQMQSSAAPANVFSWNGYDAVTVGYLHACAHFSGWVNVADCWGLNDRGQAGFDPAQLRIVPPTVGTLFGTSVARVTTQWETTCADQGNGTVQCIGDNSWGQLGNGSYASTHVPQSVGAGMSLHGVSVGFHHACALDPGGRAFCWGNGYWGELGNGASGVFPTPQPVAGGLTYRAIAAGAQHTCAIGTNDLLYCWGSNHQGQLGTQYPGGWVSTPVQAITP